jgi:hypothetical protein
MRIAINKRAGGSGPLALLWSVLAVLRPTTTFHLAPLLVAVWLAPSSRKGLSRLRMSMAGLLVAVATTGALSLMGLLEGPILLPGGRCD